MAKKKLDAEAEKPTRPCPFCLKKAHLELQGNFAGSFWVGCLDCGARGPDQHTSLQAIVAWNEGIK